MNLTLSHTPEVRAEYDIVAIIIQYLVFAVNRLTEVAKKYFWKQPRCFWRGKKPTLRDGASADFSPYFAAVCFHRYLWHKTMQKSFSSQGSFTGSFWRCCSSCRTSPPSCVPRETLSSRYNLSPIHNPTRICEHACPLRRHRNHLRQKGSQILRSGLIAPFNGTDCHQQYCTL